MFSASSPLALGYAWHAKGVASDRRWARVALGGALLAAALWAFFMAVLGLNVAHW